MPNLLQLVLRFTSYAIADEPVQRPGPGHEWRLSHATDGSRQNHPRARRGGVRVLGEKAEVLLLDEAILLD
jgi:hypothetical protein